MITLEYEGRMLRVPDNYIVIVRRGDELIGLPASEADGDEIFHMNISERVKVISGRTEKKENQE